MSRFFNRESKDESEEGAIYVSGGRGRQMTKSNIATVLGVFSALLGVATLLRYGFFYWWQNPELTEMQIFQQNWMYLVLGVLLFCGGVYVLDGEGN